jgi:hypothetical protein
MPCNLSLGILLEVILGYPSLSMPPFEITKNKSR